MKYFDSHIHTEPGNQINADALIDAMERAGVTGGAVFSYDPFFGCSLKERLDSIFDWVGEYHDRLFPFFWVHPREKDVFKTIEEAASAGVRGFKMIPTDYSVADDDVLEVIRAISATGKPIIFHSGILYDYEIIPSSDNNRPTLWENLLRLDCPVRFALAHVSWPWNDECLAVLGKMNWIHGSYKKNYGKIFDDKYSRKFPDLEMMVDTAPGPSSVWREDIFRKMFVVSPSGEAFMFGTDSFAHSYNSDAVKYWINTDSEYCKRFATDEASENYFGKSFMHFIGEDNA